MTRLLPVDEGVQNPDVDGSVFQGHTPIRILGDDEAWRRFLEAMVGREQSGLVTGLPGVRHQLCLEEGPLVLASCR